MNKQNLLRKNNNAEKTFSLWNDPLVATLHWYRNSFCFSS